MDSWFAHIHTLQVPLELLFVSRILVALLTVLERFGDFAISWLVFSEIFVPQSLITNCFECLIDSGFIEGYHCTQKQS